MASTKDRATVQRDGSRFTYPLAAGAVIYYGTIVAAAAGNAVPGAATAANVTLGIADGSADNTGGAAGAKKVQVKTGTYLLNNSATDPVAAADIGTDCYVVDNDTVAKTSDTNTRPRAGRVRAVEDGGVWVTFS